MQVCVGSLLAIFLIYVFLKDVVLNTYICVYFWNSVFELHPGTPFSLMWK